MNEKDRHEALLEKVRAALDVSEENLDPDILSRLQQARRHALRAGETGTRPRWWRSLRFPAAGFATAAVALLVAMFYFGQPKGLDPFRSLEDVEILAASESLELYNDLDFYTWLAEERDHAG